MIDLGSMTDKFSEAGQKAVRRAIELSKSRDHNALPLTHLFAALVEVESDLFVMLFTDTSGAFAELLRHLGLIRPWPSWPATQSLNSSAAAKSRPASE
jgi:hypothetical protein